jgi:serine/threonine protein kinase
MPALGDGQLFERYRIIKWLGNGSAGESYEAEDKMLLRKVTLKLIHPWTTLPDLARRQFFREMQGISVLNHRYLAPVLDYGEIDGRIYVARRYVSSGSLLGPNGRFWFRPPLAVADAFKYAHQLAQVLYHIHQHGYLHGSLTFANVLVLRGPNMENEADYAPFLLADAGLASFVRRFGKPSIEALPVSAAPEQISKRTTPASDQFALAVLLYFWLAGRPPYLGTPGEVEKLKRSETITPLSVLNPAATPEQDGLILRALTAYPEERHTSVLAFAEALVASLSSTPQPRSATTSPFSWQPETPHKSLNTSLSFEEEHLINKQAKPPDSSPSVLTSPSEDAQALFASRANDSQFALDLPSDLYTEPGKAAPITERATNSQPAAAFLSKLSETPETEKMTPESASEPTDQNHQTALVPTNTEPPMEQSSEANESATETPATQIVAAEVEISNLADGKDRKANETSLLADLTSTIPRLIISPPYSNNSYEFLLTRTETNIGRAGASDLLLDQDNLTSRHHALIKRLDEHVLIFDQRSNNGVFVNGQQIEEEHGYELVDGDHISIGSYELIFRDTPAIAPQLDR